MPLNYIKRITYLEGCHVETAITDDRSNKRELIINVVQTDQRGPYTQISFSNVTKADLTVLAMHIQRLVDSWEV